MRPIDSWHFCLLTMLMISLASIECLAQESDEIKKELPTEKIAFKVEDDSKANRPQKKKIRYIIKNGTSGILYGNPCVLQVTRRMGFEYAVQTPLLPGSTIEPRRLWNNFKVKLVLALKYSPFWKISLNKRLKECGIKSGDRVG
ncbi:MAG: hypothetical protein RIF33_19665 [Cyclobacteriaceae bacterium]